MKTAKKLVVSVRLKNFRIFFITFFNRTSETLVFASARAPKCHDRIKSLKKKKSFSLSKSITDLKDRSSIAKLKQVLYVLRENHWEIQCVQKEWRRNFDQAVGICCEERSFFKKIVSAFSYFWVKFYVTFFSLPACQIQNCGHLQSVINKITARDQSTFRQKQLHLPVIIFSILQNSNLLTFTFLIFSFECKIMGLGSSKSSVGNPDIFHTLVTGQAHFSSRAAQTYLVIHVWLQTTTKIFLAHFLYPRKLHLRRLD